MNNPIKTIYESTKKTLQSKGHFKIFIISTILFFAVLILLPTLLTPGNTLIFQLSIFTYWNYILMILISALIGLMITMHVYVYKIKKSAKGVGRGAVGGVSSLTAGIFGTASCSSCVAALFGFLGIGTVFFLLKYQWYIVGISVFLVLFSIYFAAVSVEKNCEVCK